MSKEDAKSELKVATAIGEYCARDNLDSRREKMVSDEILKYSSF